MGPSAKQAIKQMIRMLGMEPHRLKRAVSFPPKLVLLSCLPLLRKGTEAPAQGSCMICSGNRLRRRHWPLSLLAQVAEVEEILRAGTSRFEFLECEDCGGLFRPPKAQDGRARGYYEEDYWPRSQSEPDYLAQKHAEKTEVFRRIFQGGLKRWLEEAGVQRVLEIGCFVGSWIYHLRQHGYEVEGVEPSRAAAKYGNQVLGLKIHNNFYNRDLFADENWDAALCFHVIEHLEQPQAFLRAMRVHLRPGGTAIIEVPDIGPDGLPIRPERLAICVADAQWRLSLARGTHEHNLIFNQQSFRHLLESNGFDFVEAVTDPAYTSKENTLLVRARRR